MLTIVSIVCTTVSLLIRVSGDKNNQKLFLLELQIKRCIFYISKDKTFHLSRLDLSVVDPKHPKMKISHDDHHWQEIKWTRTQLGWLLSSLLNLRSANKKFHDGSQNNSDTRSFILISFVAQGSHWFFFHQSPTIKFRNYWPSYLSMRHFK